MQTAKTEIILPAGKVVLTNKYQQSMFLSGNKKNNVYPCKPQFHYIKVGFKGVKTIKACFRYVRLWGPRKFFW